MTGNSIPRASSEVKALRVVLIALLLLYGLMIAVTLVFMATVFPSLADLPSALPFMSIIRFIFDRLGPGTIYCFIAYNIFKLISVISRGEPFSPKSPRYIRRIGYAVLCLAAINAVVNAFSSFPLPYPAPAGFLSKAVIGMILSGLSTLLLGFGFLVIARVIEVGVRLQQDQNLTV
ncbi:MAG: DUF2975 domain-containing protein [Candidatus Aminicenantales bacterium]